MPNHSLSRKMYSLFIGIIVIAIFFTSNPFDASAATIVVDGTNCTLTDAILSTNADSDTGTCTVADGEVTGSYGDDVISISSDITLTSAYSGNNGLPPVTDTLTLQSDVSGTQRTISRSSASNFRILSIAGVEVIITDLILNNGKVAAFSGGGAGLLVQSGSAVTLNNVGITNNTSTGIVSTSGGGISTTTATLTIHDSEISNNTSSSGGGIMQNGGTVEIYNSEISSNTSIGTASGSALLLQQSGTTRAAIYNSEITNNSGKTAVYVLGVTNTLDFTFEDSIFSGNSSSGDLTMSKVVGTISGSTFDNNVSTVNSLVGTEIAGISIKNSTVAIEQSTISNNTSGGSAGIYVVGESVVDITNVTVSGNEADDMSGIITDRGGHGSSGRTLTIIHSTITNNNADVAGLVVRGESGDSATAEITNNIIAENNGSSAENCSLDDQGSAGTASLVSHGGNIIGDVSVNLGIVTASCVASLDLVEDVYDILDAGIENLDDNGGLTETHALEDASIAIDFVITETTGEDQRDISRPQDGNGDGEVKSDSGAYEVGTVTPPTECTGSRCTPTLPRFGCKDPNADPFLSINYIPLNDLRYNFYFHQRAFCAYTYFGFTIEPGVIPPDNEDAPESPEDPLLDEDISNEPITPPALPADTTTAACPFFKTPLKPRSLALTSEQIQELALWQAFLQSYADHPLVFSGAYSEDMVPAVKKFQKRFTKVILLPWTLSPSKISYEKTKNGTGYIYKTTRAVANYIMGCGSESVFIEDTGATIDIQTEMQKYYPEVVPVVLPKEPEEATVSE